MGPVTVSVYSSVGLCNKKKLIYTPGAARTDGSGCVVGMVVVVSAYSSVALTELLWILYNMVSLTIWRRCCRQGGLLQFLEHVHDARGVVVAPEDIYMYLAALHCIASFSSVAHWAWWSHTVEACSRKGFMKDLYRLCA